MEEKGEDESLRKIIVHGAPQAGGLGQATASKSVAKGTPNLPRVLGASCAKIEWKEKEIETKY